MAANPFLSALTSIPIPTPRPAATVAQSPFSGFQNFLGNNNQALMAAGVGLLSGKTGPEQVALAAQGFGAARNQNMTMKWLSTVDPDLAEAVRLGAIDPASAMKLAYSQKLEAQKPDYMSVGNRVFDKRSGKFLDLPAQNDATTGDLGLNPQYGVDAQGNPVLLQLGKSGKAYQTQMPEGVQLSKEPIKLDAGTHYVLLDPITRQPVGQIPKENYQEAYDTGAGGAAGKLAGEMQANAPNQIARANQTVAQIDQLLADPNLDSAVGSVQGRIPLWARGQGVNDVSARIDQLQGKAFLEAYSMLKGGGQITEIEGQKAEAALARLQRTQGDTAYRQALKDFRDAVAEGAAKLQAAYGGGANGGIQAPAATGGDAGWTTLSNGVRIRQR